MHLNRSSYILNVKFRQASKTIAINEFEIWTFFSIENISVSLFYKEILIKVCEFEFVTLCSANPLWISQFDSIHYNVWVIISLI